jgi:hypothetical protein
MSSAEGSSASAAGAIGPKHTDRLADAPTDMGSKLDMRVLGDGCQLWGANVLVVYLLHIGGASTRLSDICHSHHSAMWAAQRIRVRRSIICCGHDNGVGQETDALVK